MPTGAPVQERGPASDKRKGRPGGGRPPGDNAAALGGRRGNASRYLTAFPDEGGSRIRSAKPRFSSSDLPRPLLDVDSRLARR
jgi:hypothetical protein